VLIALGPVPENPFAVAVLAFLAVSLPHGMLSDHDRAQAVSPTRIGAPNSWVRSVDGLAGVSSGHDIGRRLIRGGLKDAA
jgi:hypothetical protein